MNKTRILKNLSNLTINTISYSKIIVINPKSTLTIDDSQADQIAEELLHRFGFLRDITPKPQVNVEIKEMPEMNQKGRVVMKKKKIVKKAEGVKKL